eukprot:1952915-Pleurochrysis_carterae.AAC.1
MAGAIGKSSGRRQARCRHTAHCGHTTRRRPRRSSDLEFKGEDRQNRNTCTRAGAAVFARASSCCVCVCVWLRACANRSSLACIRGRAH